jgi:hypothetical protein
MSYAFSASSGGADSVSAVVLDAARCWRAARDAGPSVQPCLFATLRAHGAEMLAPVFDSLMSLYESALGRRLQVGEGAVVSEDEQLLLNLLGGSQRACTRLERNDGVAVALRCALCSTRIMMRHALDCGAPPTIGSNPG